MFTYTNKKAILRKKYLNERLAFSEEEINELSEIIFENFLKNFQIFENQNVHIFLPIKKFNELNTLDFINYFFEKKLNVFVPKIVDGKMIAVKILPDTEFEENSWGIPEPESKDNHDVSFDFIITPLLYCDHNGNRIGYGKGFYDVFFNNNNALKIGINIFSPNEGIEDVSNDDIPLDYLVTPTEILSFKGFTSKFTK